MGYLNKNNNYNFLFITDWLSEADKNEFAKFENFSYIHTKGLKPRCKKIAKRKIILLTKIIKQINISYISYSKEIVAYYLSNFLYGFYEPYLKNHKIFTKLIDLYSPTKVIFPSFIGKCNLRC